MFKRTSYTVPSCGTPAVRGLGFELLLWASAAAVMMGGCYDRDIAAGFCERDCAELWTAACETHCGFSRPIECPDDAQSCPILSVDGDDGLGDGSEGEIIGSVNSGGTLTGEEDEAPILTDGSGGTSSAGSGSDSGGDGQQEPELLGPCGALCPEGRPICDVGRKTCVECADDLDCRRTKLGRYCVDQHCMGCSTDADCSSPDAPHCDETASACVGCRSSSDCAHVTVEGTPLPICDIMQRACVQCTGTDYDACSVDRVSGEPLICDSASGSCTNREAGSASLCDTCLSDAHCGTGMRCVREVLGDETLGYVCLWELGGEGAPKSCDDDSARPFDREYRQVRSIDFALVDVCGLSATTCEALTESGIQSCAGPNADDSCGIAGLDDGLCRPASDDSDLYVCTTPCQEAGDCESGSACVDEEGGGFCEASAAP